MSLRLLLCCYAPVIIIVAVWLYSMWLVSRKDLTRIFGGKPASQQTTFSPPDYEGLEPEGEQP